jgi:ribose transport system permease protein
MTETPATTAMPAGATAGTGVQSPDAIPPAGGDGGVRARRPSVLERYGGLGLLIVMFVGFSIALGGKFLNYDNLIGVVSNQTVIGIMALALLLPLAAGVFDISIAGTMTLSVVLVTWLFQTTSGSIGIPVAIALTLLAGVVIGAVNGGLVLRGRVDPFIGTIAVGGILVGISQAIANGSTITESIPSGFTSLARTEIASVPITVVYLLVLLAVLWYVTEYTPFGRQAYATGAGRDAARLAGVRTSRVICISFIVCAVLAALAGIIYAARLGAGPPGIGASYLLSAYAVAFLGSTTIRPGRFNVGGLVVALCIVAIGINGLQLAGLSFWISELYQGVILIVAVLISRARTA